MKNCIILRLTWHWYGRLTASCLRSHTMPFHIIIRIDGVNRTRGNKTTISINDLCGRLTDFVLRSRTIKNFWNSLRSITTISCGRLTDYVLRSRTSKKLIIFFSGG